MPLSNMGMDVFNSEECLDHLMFHLARYKFAKGFLKSTDSVLDIACGTGYGTRMLSDYCNDIVGVDINEDTVEYASEKYGGENRSFNQGSILEVEGEYDIIVCFETIEHMCKEAGVVAVENLKSCLKPGGVLFISTPKRLPIEERSKGRVEHHMFEYSYEDFVLLLSKQFDRPVIFSQTDEIITIGNHKSVWTYVGVCCG